MSGSPKVVFECEGTRYNFDRRTVELSVKGDPVKIGRSQGPLKPQPDNAIFDCRVLSRTHAQIRFYNEKFFLRDTGSSNGTFVNGQKLAEEEHQVLTSDVLQFGVDVDNSPRQQTIPCVVCQVKCFLPDGTEVESNPASATCRDTYIKANTNVTKVTKSQNNRNIYLHDDVKIRGGAPDETSEKEIQELRAEVSRSHVYADSIENKFLKLQGVLQDITIVQQQQRDEKLDEDILLTKIECLENMLQGDNLSELQDEHRRVCQEKADLEQISKNALRRSLQEKLFAQTELEALKSTVDKAKDDNERKDIVIQKFQEKLRSFGLDSTGKALDIIRGAVSAKQLSEEEIEVFQTLSQIVFPEAFPDPSSSITQFKEAEVAMELECSRENEGNLTRQIEEHVSQYQILQKELEEQKELTAFKDYEVEAFQKERHDLVERIGVLTKEQDDLNKAILREAEAKTGEALSKCQQREMVIYLLISFIILLLAVGYAR